MLPTVLMPNLRQGLRLRLDLFHEESTRKGTKNWIWRSSWPDDFEMPLCTGDLQMTNYDCLTSHVLDYLNMNAFARGSLLTIRSVTVSITVFSSPRNLPTLSIQLISKIVFFLSAAKKKTKVTFALSGTNYSDNEAGSLCWADSLASKGILIAESQPTNNIEANSVISTPALTIGFSVKLHLTTVLLPFTLLILTTAGLPHPSLRRRHPPSRGG